MTKVVAIFGLSGVGKSTLINNYISSNQNWHHLQAGQLIHSALKNVEHDKLRLAGEDTVLKNQYLMVGAFWDKVRSNNLDNIIFDGHSTIDMETDILDIPVDVIEQLFPYKLIFLKASPEIIMKRRSVDKSRDRPPLTKEEIEEQQDRALKQFYKYGESLSLSPHILENADIDVLHSLIQAE